MMTKQDFIVFAECIACITDPADRMKETARVAHYCAQVNPRFSFERFTEWVEKKALEYNRKE